MRRWRGPWREIAQGIHQLDCGALPDARRREIQTVVAFVSAVVVAVAVGAGAGAGVGFVVFVAFVLVVVVHEGRLELERVSGEKHACV